MAHRDLADFLSVLEAHNDNRSKPLLLGPYLFRIIHSVEAKNDIVQRMPVLERRPSDLRDHYQSASKSAKALARLLRKGPQPSVVLSAHDEVREAFSLFQPFGVIQSPNQFEAIVPLDRLLHEAAASLDLITARIPPAIQYRKGVKAKTERLDELRHLAASVLATRFRQELSQPYHSHVATIVRLLTGITTDSDYVKKIDKRSRRAATPRGQMS